jgi:lariat debranching enzyme
LSLLHAQSALDEIFASVGQIEKRRAVKVDLLIICGDFQALRNEDDYESLAVPPK